MANSSLTGALIIVLMINLMLWFSQIAILSINPEQEQIFFNKEGSIIDSFDEGNYSLDTDVSARIPTNSDTVDESTGNIFTDIWSTFKNWFLESTGLGYLINVLSAPFNFLQAIKLPPEFAFGLGALWYAMTFLLVLMFMRGS